MNYIWVGNEQLSLNWKQSPIYYVMINPRSSSSKDEEVWEFLDRAASPRVLFMGMRSYYPLELEWNKTHLGV